MIYCGVQPEYLEKEKRKKNRADLASGKKKLIAQQTDRGKRHHKCNILSKLIFVELCCTKMQHRLIQYCYCNFNSVILFPKLF